MKRIEQLGTAVSGPVARLRDRLRGLPVRQEIERLRQLLRIHHQYDDLVLIEKEVGTTFRLEGRTLGETVVLPDVLYGESGEDITLYLVQHADPEGRKFAEVVELGVARQILKEKMDWHPPESPEYWIAYKLTNRVPEDPPPSQD